MTRNNATFVGSAFADVSAGSRQEVLCLVPWTPVIVNDGHECLVAVANHPGDPLPAPLPDAFEPPTYREVARRNLSVLSGRLRATTIALTVAAVARADKAVTVTVDGGGELDKRILAALGLADLRPAQGRLVEVGSQRQEPCADENEPAGDNTILRMAGRS